MATKRGSVEAARPHTFAKHRLLREYLGAWFSILLRARYFPKLTVLDGFAGPGVYPGGQPGSPAIIIEELLKALRGRSPSKAIELIFIEADGNDFASLERILDGWRHRLPAGVEVTARKGLCQELAVPVLEERESFGNPLLAVLDAEGFDVPYSLVERIARSRSSEVLVTLVTARFVQFAAKPSVKSDSVFGDIDWRSVADEHPSQKHEFIVDAYRQRLRRAGFNGIQVFELTEETGYPLHIFHGTKHLKGFQAMKRPRWNVDPVRGAQFRDPRDPARIQLGFDLGPALEDLKAELRRQVLVDNGWHRVGEVKAWVQTTRWEDGHVTKALEEMLKAGELERQGGKTKRLTWDVQVRLRPTLF